MTTQMRYEALYDDLGRMDKVAEKEMEHYLTTLKEEVGEKQKITWAEVDTNSR